MAKEVAGYTITRRSALFLIPEIRAMSMWVNRTQIAADMPQIWTDQVHICDDLFKSASSAFYFRQARKRGERWRVKASARGVPLPTGHARARHIRQQRFDGCQQIVQGEWLDQVDIDTRPLLNALDRDVGGDDHNLGVG
jgi:hypothetical protein